MTASFDPYLKWLGIPPKHQPPNAYRLLGIELFESDDDVIANAADQRMAHLKNFAAGEHSKISQTILNEIAAARVRLLNAEQKAKYDRALREHLDEQKRPAVRSAAQAKPRAVAEVVPVAPVAAVVPVIDTGETASRGPAAAEAQPKRPRPWLLPAAIGGSLLLVIIVVVLASVMGGNGDDDVAVDDDPSSRTPDVDPVPGVAPADDTDDEHVLPVNPPVKKPPVVKVPRADPKATLVFDWPEDQRSDVRLLIDDAVVPIPATGSVEYPVSAGAHRMVISRPGYETVTARVSLRSGERRLFQPKWKPTKVAVVPKPPPDKPPKEDPPGDDNPPPDVTIAKKLLPPDADTKRSKVKEIREIYRDEFAGATDPARKAALARQLSNDGEGTKDSPADRFVLLEMAVDLATEGGDLTNALAIIDRIDQLYAVDGMGMKAEALSTVAKAILTRPGATSLNQEIVSLARELQSEALSRADVKSAGKFVRIAIPAARKLKDKRLLAQLQESLDELNGLQKRYDTAQQAVAALARTPDHPLANEVAGSWYCFIAGDWKKGLPWLAKGEDAALAELARQDLAGPKEPAKQVAMGDRWYEIADKRKGLESSRLEARASHWYKQALPKLTGLEARRLEKRLSEMGVSLGNFALKFDGQKSYVVVPNFPIGMNVPITVEAIVKPGAPIAGVRTSSSTQAILGNINTPGEAGLSLDRYSSGWAFRFYTFYHSTYGSVYEQLERPSYSSYTSRDEDKWVHVAGVFDGRQVRLYVDGQLKDSEAVSTTYMHNPSRLQFMIGAAPSGYSTQQAGPTDFFRGQIKAVRVSKAVVYTASFAPPAELANLGSSTVLLLRLDEGSGIRVKNAKGGKIQGEIHDAEWVKVESTPPATAPPATAPPATGRLPSRPTPPRTTPSRTPPPPVDPSQPQPSFDHLPRRSPPSE